MAKVDDFVQRRLKQIVLTFVARLAHRSHRSRISPARESRTVQIRNPKTQENRNLRPAFLQNRILVQVKTQRQINHFRILHGRPSTSVFCNFSPFRGYKQKKGRVARNSQRTKSSSVSRGKITGRIHFGSPRNDPGRFGCKTETIPHLPENIMNREKLMFAKRHAKAAASMAVYIQGTSMQ